MTLLGLTAAWLAGIALVDATPFSGWQWLALGLVAGSFASLNRSHRRTGFIFACLAVLSIAGAWTLARRTTLPDNHISHLNDTGVPLSLVGWVKEPPQYRDEYTGLLVETERIETSSGGELAASGEVLVFAPTGITVSYGDRLVVEGDLETPPKFETFDYREYLARQGVYSVFDAYSVSVLDSGAGLFPMNLIYRFRRSARETIFRLFPQPESSLLAGILIGDEYSIPDTLREDFNRTGTTHIIAISGFNITIIAALFLGLFQRPLGARWGTVAAILGIALYTVLVGADAAVVRAAFMAGVSFLALRLGRQNNALSALAASAWLMTLLNPLTLWDVGFQLSFAATLGLILYGQPAQESLILRIQHRWAVSAETALRWGGPLGETVLFTLAAQLTTLPLSALYFGRLPVAAGLANPIVLPLQPGVMILSGAATLLGMIWLPLGQAVSWLGWGFAALTIRVVEVFASLPLASIEFTSVPVILPAAFYFVLFSLTLPTWRGARPAVLLARLSSKPLPTGVLLAGLGLGTIFSWSAAVARPDGLLHVTALNVPAGQALLVQSPTGRNLLINGGSSAVLLEGAIGRRLAPISRELDWVIVASTEQNSTAGLRNLSLRTRIGAALLSPDARGRDLETFLEGLSASDSPVIPIEQGQTLELGDDAIMRVIHTEESSVLLEISYGRANFLLPFGVISEAHLHAIDPERTAVFIGSKHDGRQLLALLERALPAVVVLSRSTGESPVPLDPALLSYSGTVRRTDQSGWIKLTTDGGRLWVEVERQP